jgi:hypothetical protein
MWELPSAGRIYGENGRHCFVVLRDTDDGSSGWSAESIAW